jgi:hypothetical protein
VHQGILDHLAAAGFSNQNMDISETSVQFNGDKAEALVEIVPKGASHDQGMQMRYSLQHQNGRWVVIGRVDAGGGHGGAVVPGSANPHNDAPPSDPAAGGQKMPSPDDLPPSGKKQ